MKLSKLFKNININYHNDIDINNISINSKEIKKGDLFIAIKGYIRDGHDYIDEAINNGAIVILINNDRYNEFKNKNVIVISVNNTRKICYKLACNYYNNPSKDFILIGITGTKGKTTSAFMLRDILIKSGKNVGLISTVASYINNDKIHDNDRTTPEAFELQKTFELMRKNKCKYVIIEVSSQSLKLNRVDGSDFDIGLFLNLSKDHVSKNEHPTLEDYFNCKLKLFDMVNVGFVNIDDKKGQIIYNLKKNIYTYGINNNSDKGAFNIEFKNDYYSFTTIINNKECTINLPLLGIFNVYNALGVISIADYLNIDENSIKNALKEVTIPGRGELVQNKLGITIMIDYAHNEKSMGSVLKLARELKKGKIICVFGCAGDRDSEKRPKMGELSGKLSDYAIITSDNPASEDPKDICLEIESGIKEITNNYEIIVDREQAIKRAIKIACKDDIILLLGKGHETYQIIGDDKIPFSEKEIIQKYTNQI